MKVIGFAGYSGAGKTALVEALVMLMKQRGLRVSVIKHAHHDFDVDREGKDSWRHRKAGAYEVLLASDRRMALMREYEQPAQLSVHHMLAQLDPSVDWVLVELRNAQSPTGVEHTFGALVLDDGTVIAPEGGPLRIPLTTGTHHKLRCQ